MFGEMEGHIAELSMLTYAHFIVLRLFKEIKGPEEQKRVAKTFRGQAVRLATHAIGARVVQTALDSLPTASAALIKVRFVSHPQMLFTATTCNAKSPGVSLWGVLLYCMEAS